MNILLVGGGAREHTIAWKLRQSPRVDELLVAPGNAGTARIARNLPQIKANDLEGIAQAAREHKVDLVVVGPEEPLVLGLADRLAAEGIPYSRRLVVRRGVHIGDNRDGGFRKGSLIEYAPKPPRRRLHQR